MQEQVNNIEADLKEVKEALLGSDYNKNGIIQRIDKIEKYQNIDKKQKWTLAGIITGLMLIFKFW